MEYCKRCVYPKNAQPTITFDEEGICSGCRTIEAKQEIDWDERKDELEEILKSYKAEAKKRKNNYDCIIPVSGGKDSHYQVYLAKEVYDLNPLLVVFNHNYNTRLGLRNLRNIVKQFDCDLIRVTAKPQTVRKLSRYMIKKVGDLTWHYHTGIYTVPFQVAVNYNIPLVIWGEHGYGELTGVVRLEDKPDFTKWMRDEYDMRGVELEEVIEDVEGIDQEDLFPYVFPDYERFQDVGVRGIHLGNYHRWDHLKQVKYVTNHFDFDIYEEPRERTFCQYAKTDDHANDVHDYLRYLKFGYGRGTEHASDEIRLGRMTREEGIAMAEKYDDVRPDSLDTYLNFLDMTEEEFEAAIEPMRDESIWEKKNGEWVTKDSVGNHEDDDGVEDARISMVDPEDRVFGENNKNFYYSDSFEPLKGQDQHYVSNKYENEFIIL